MKTFAVLAVLFYVSSASAYVDPGTGGMLLQLVLGGVAGLMMVGKLYWQRIFAAWRRLAGRGKSEFVKTPVEVESE